MEKVKNNHLPRGTHSSPRGKRTDCVGIMKLCTAVFLLVGILFIGLSVQTIRSEASAMRPDDEIPKDVKKYCEEIGSDYGICPELLEAIAWHESRFIPTAKNKKCWGLCQINIKVHKDRIEKYGYTDEDMLEPYANLTVAADLLAELYEQYGDDNPIILMLYSGAGWDAIEKYKEYGFLTEYVEDILTRSASYERLHGK